MKKIITRIISIQLIIAMLCTFIPIIVSAANSGTCGDNLTWTLDDDGTLTISGTGDMYDYEYSKTPWWTSQTSINTVIIKDGVTNIGNYAFHTCTSLTSITIPDSVTSIGGCAFDDCISLTSITIPNSVTSINDSAFFNCTSLTSITIPNSVTIISNGAFEYCTSLKSITIPDSVTSIGDYAFYNCGNLTNITIPDSVTSIGIGAFEYCTSLKSITIPDSVTSIGDEAFRDCDSLTDVYYGGSEADWAKITIDSGNSCLTNATIHYNSSGTGGNGGNSGGYNGYTSVNNGIFYFASGKGEARYNYDDSYFENSSFTYNHDLAKASIRLALSAFGKITGKSSTACGYFGKSYENVKYMMSDMGFEQLKHNSWYEKAPTKSSIGVAVGSKRVAYPDGNYTLIAVAVRGGGYENEWGGNFSVGNGNLHEGFKTARDQVISFVRDYISDCNISGNVKLWITGYSRAAATTNLTAGLLDENPGILSADITLTPDNIYAYCFEAPAGVVNPDNASGIYNNIFSIVNQHDFVPMVAPRKWGYDRYGITKYLPAAQTNSNYIELRDNMTTYYKKYHSGTYKIDDFAYNYLISGEITDIKTGLYYGQGVFLDRTMDKLASAIKNTDNYEKNYQAVLEYVGEKIVGEGLTEPLINSLIKEFEKRELLIKYEIGGTVYASLVNPFLGISASSSIYFTARAIVRDAFENLGIAVNDTVLNGITELIIDVGIEDAYTLFKNRSSIKQAHFPEICMAWLDAIDENDFVDRRLRTLYLNCPVDLEVYDSDDNLVAAVYSNEVQAISGSSIIAYVDENGQKIVYLPQDEEYRIEVIATDDGDVTYSVREQNTGTGESKVINYNNMTVSKNDTLTGTAENLTSCEDATYLLASNSVEISEAEIIENAEPIEINAIADGNGIASGGGDYYKGEFAQVVAAPFDDEKFLGWYNGDTLVSSDTAYRFQVTEATELTAKFTQNTCAVTLADDNDDIIDVIRTLKGNTVTITGNPQKSGYTFDGIYQDKAFETPFSADTLFYEDTTLYVKLIKNINITNVSFAENTITVNAEITDSLVEKSGVVLAALYYEHEPVDFKQASAATNIDFKFENIPSAENAYTVKIMYWNSVEDLTPLDIYDFAEIVQ